MDELTQDIRQEEYNLLEKNEIDRFISQEEASLATQAHADKVNNLTDYEHKQVKKDNEDLIHTLITDIRNEIGMNEVQEKPSDILKNIGEEEAQRTPPDDEPKSKGPAKTLPPYAPPHFHLPYTSFRYLSKFSDSSNPVLKAYGNGFKLGADLIGSTLEGAENFIKAFPKKYEALKNDFNGADVKDHLNELKEYSLNESKYSSGDFVTDKGVDIPRVAGNMVGFAAPVIGTGVLAAKASAAAGLGYLGTTAAVGASEFALGAVLTTKDSGSLFNFLEDMDWVDREVATKIPFYVTKSDSELMASLKGGSENLLLFMAPILGLAGFKAGQSVYKNRQAIQKTVVDVMQKTGDLVKEGIVTRHLKGNPNLVDDYARVAKKGIYNKSEFLDFAVRDYVTKEIDNRSVLGFVFDDEGSIFIGSKNNKGLKAADEAVSEIAENLDGATGKQINDFKEALKVNNLEKVSVSYDALRGNKLITKNTKTKLRQSVEFLEDHKKAMARMKVSEPSVYKAIQDIVNDDAKSSTITVQEINNGTFLGKMSKSDSDIHDLFLKVKESGFHKDHVEKLTEIFPETKAKTISDAEATKVTQDFLDTYGYTGSAKDLSKGQIKDLVEITAIAEVVQEKALAEAVEIGRKLNNFAMDPKDLSSRRKYQMLAIAAHKSRLALEQTTNQFNQIRHDLGAAFRLLQPKVRQKIQSKIVEFADKDLLDEKSQMILMEQFVQLDETKLRNFYKKLDDLETIMKKDKVGSRDAYNKLLRKGSFSNFVENANQFFYNNFLANMSTQTSATFGLATTATFDTIQDAVIKNLMRSTYYGTNNISNKQDAQMVLSVLKQLDADKGSSTSLLAQGKFLTNFRKPDGSLKNGKEIFKEAFITGRSVIDEGSEKYGLGYGRLTSEADKQAATKAASPIEEPADIFQEILRDTFVEEASHVSTTTDFFGSKSSNPVWDTANKVADVHSAPLRFLQAADEFIKHKRIFSKYHQILSEKVSKRFAAVPEKKLIELRKDKSKFDKFVENLYKKELNNIDNFTDAKVSTREVTFQNKYNDGVTPDFAITPFRSHPISGALKYLKHPLISALHPFARIAVNFSDWMTQYTPGIGLLNTKIADDLAAGGYRRAQAITKQSTGMLLASTCYYLAEKGIVTGGYSSNRKFRSDQKRSGYPVNSLNIGDETSIPLQRLEPLGAFCTTIADLRNKIVESHNKGDLESVEKGMGALGGMIKIGGQLFVPSVVQDFHDLLGVPFSSKDLTPKEKVRKTANVINNLSTRSFPKFLIFQHRWFKEDIKRQTTEYDRDGVSVFKSFRNHLYNTEYGFLYKEAIEQLGDAAKDYHANELEPELDDFGREVNRHGIPKELMENYSDSEYIDLLYSPIFSSSTFKQRKINPDPVYKELRRLNKNFVEHFKTGVYSGDNLGELDADEKFIQSLQILPDIPRSVKIQNLSGTSIPYRLNNKEYNELKKFINMNNEYYNLVKDEIDLAKREKLNDADMALRIYGVSREYVTDMVKEYLEENMVDFTLKANEVTKQTVK